MPGPVLSVARRQHWGVAVLLAVGCATAPPVLTLAPSPGRDALLEPRVPSPEPPPGLLTDGPDRPIKDGQCKGLPAGMWMSERKFQLRTAAILERNRLRTDVETLRQLAIDERAAAVEFESACRRRALDADRRAELRLWVGILIGAGAVLAGGWAIGQAR
jgi:hypothetical protein